MDEMTFVKNAAEKDDRVPEMDFTQVYPGSQTLHALSGMPYNWVPSISQERLLKAQDSHTEYVEIALEIREKALDFAEKEGLTHLVTDGFYQAPYMTVIGIMIHFGRRTISGLVGELAAKQWIEAKGLDVVGKEKALELTGYDSIEEMENNEVDLVDENGKTYQVKNVSDRHHLPDETAADSLLWLNDGDIVEVE